MTMETNSPEQQVDSELSSISELDVNISTLEEATLSAPAKPPGSYVKLAMRNMVRKRSKSLQHFFLSTLGLLVLFVGLAYLTR